MKWGVTFLIGFLTAMVSAPLESSAGVSSLEISVAVGVITRKGILVVVLTNINYTCAGPLGADNILC